MTVIRVDGKEAFEAETLYECVPFLVEIGVRRVNLSYTWSRRFLIDAPDRRPFTSDGQLRLWYVGTEIDNEYSFFGVFDKETFSEWAFNYVCWDDAGLSVIDGVLSGCMDGQDECSEINDAVLDVTEWESVELLMREWYDAKAGRWRQV